MLLECEAVWLDCAVDKDSLLVLCLLLWAAIHSNHQAVHMVAPLLVVVCLRVGWAAGNCSFELRMSVCSSCTVSASLRQIVWAGN